MAAATCWAWGRPSVPRLAPRHHDANCVPAAVPTTKAVMLRQQPAPQPVPAASPAPQSQPRTHRRVPVQPPSGVVVEQASGPSLAEQLSDHLTAGRNVLVLGYPAGPQRTQALLAALAQRVTACPAALPAAAAARGPNRLAPRAVRALVLCATREGAEALHMVGYSQLTQHGLRTQLLQGRSCSVQQDVAQLRSSPPDVVFTTPGRAMELLSAAPRGCKLGDAFGGVHLLVLDGAAGLLGSPAMRCQAEAVVVALRRMANTAHGRGPAPRQLLLLDAAPALAQGVQPHAQAVVRCFSGTDTPLAVVRPPSPAPAAQGAPVAAMLQGVCAAPPDQLSRALFAVLRSHTSQRPRHRVLVLCPSVGLARVWARVARLLGFATLEMHGRRSASYRAAAMQAFRAQPSGGGDTPPRPTTSPHGTQGLETDESLEDEMMDVQDVWGAPGLVLFSAGGATQAAAFPHLTLLLQAGLPRHAGQLADYAAHTRVLAARMPPATMRKRRPPAPTAQLVLCDAELAGLPALATALRAAGAPVVEWVAHQQRQQQQQAHLDRMMLTEQHALGRVDAALSRVGTRLRQVAWLSWMQHLRDHPLVAPPHPNAWQRVCMGLCAALALDGPPAVPAPLAAAWGRGYMQGMVPEAGSTGQQPVVVAGGPHDLQTTKAKDTAAARRRRLVRAYVWQRALHRMGDAAETDLLTVVQRRLNREYARRWRVYWARAAAWRKRLKERRKQSQRGMGLVEQGQAAQ